MDFGGDRSGGDNRYINLVIAYFRITPTRARAILTEVEGAVSVWQREGLFLGMTSNELEAFAEAFEHNQRVTARAIIQ
jgi:serine/threonine-protein kinase HipA